MEHVEEYLKQAKDCLDRAAKAELPSVRAAYIEMAEHWEMLARQRAAQLGLEDLIATVPKRNCTN